MEKLRLIHGYRDHDGYRNSFFELAASVFGIDFKSWYAKGYWGERYIPYSFATNGKIIANVSVNLLDFIVEGNTYKAVQIGTVMTHPDYRNQGLSAKLMNHILDVYKDKYDYMYLFANKSVLGFYPKFGFERADESQYSMSLSYPGNAPSRLQKLNIDVPSDLELVERLVFTRKPISKRFSTDQSAGITMFHVLNVFNNDLYYSEEDDAIVIYIQHESNMHVYDVISRDTIELDKLLFWMADGNTRKMIFHYTPDYNGVYFDRVLYQRDGAFFLKTNGGLSFPSQVMHPVTSEA